MFEEHPTSSLADLATAAGVDVGIAERRLANLVGQRILKEQRDPDPMQHTYTVIEVLLDEDTDDDFEERDEPEPEPEAPAVDPAWEKILSYISGMLKVFAACCELG